MAFADLVTAADRAAIERLGGVEVLYQPDVGDPVSIEGIFDSNSVLVDQDETGTEIRGPAVFLRLEDLPADPDEDDPTLTIEGKDYGVRGRERDGLGGIRLFLVAA